MSWHPEPETLYEAWMESQAEDWYGTQDHQRFEDRYAQAEEGSREDYQEPPNGTWIPGLGEV